MGRRGGLYNAIMDAAETVVIEAGAMHMTLDAVAAKAGVSKGGLLHHFPTKAALIEAMINRLIETKERLREKIWKELPESPVRSTKAFVLSAVRRDKKFDRLGGSLLAALAHDPKLAEPVRKVMKKVYDEIISEGGRIERAAVPALAAQGLALHEVLSISPFTEQQRDKIIEEVLRMAEESAGQRVNDDQSNPINEEV